MSKRIIITLNDIQGKALRDLMTQDLETNVSAYMSRFITQEYLRRQQATETAKRPVGRPKKTEEVEDKNMYPAPYKGGAPYSRQDWEMYWAWRLEKGQIKEMPPLPDPLTAEELQKWD